MQTCWIQHSIAAENPHQILIVPRTPAGSGSGVGLGSLGPKNPYQIPIPTLPGPTRGPGPYQDRVWVSWSLIRVGKLPPRLAPLSRGHALDPALRFGPPDNIQTSRALQLRAQTETPIRPPIATVFDKHRRFRPLNSTKNHNQIDSSGPAGETPFGGGF